MDTRKLVLFFIFAFSILMLADAWTKAQRPAAEVATSGASADDAKGTAPAAVPVPNAPAIAVPQAGTAFECTARAPTTAGPSQRWTGSSRAG